MSTTNQVAAHPFGFARWLVACDISSPPPPLPSPEPGDKTRGTRLLSLPVVVVARTSCALWASGCYFLAGDHQGIRSGLRPWMRTFSLGHDTIRPDRIGSSTLPT